MEEGNHNNPTSILTADEFLKIGLQLVRYKKRWIRRAKKRSNVERLALAVAAMTAVIEVAHEDATLVTGN
jgi:hypothetical protein